MSLNAKVCVAEVSFNPRELRRSAAANLAAAGELVAAVLPKLPGAGPSAADEVTVDWLTQHLVGMAAGAVAQHVSTVVALPARRTGRLAVEWNEAGRAAGLPANLFVKSTPLSAKNRTMVAKLGMAVNEARFYNQAAGGLGGIAPHAWYAHAGGVRPVSIVRRRTWDATAMTVNWPGLQAQENTDAAFRRACAAVDDLETAALMNRLYR